MVKRNTGLRLDDATLARVDAYLEQLRREPGRSDATQADAIRTLLDFGLEHVSPAGRRPRSRKR